METTRRYPRTMADAFKGASYACAITRPPESFIGRVVDALAWIVALCLLVGMVFAPFIFDLN